MKKFTCSYVLNDRPESLEIWANDPATAVCAALDQLGSAHYRRMELSDDCGIIYFRQAPSSLAGAIRAGRRNRPPLSQEAVPAWCPRQPDSQPLVGQAA